MPAHPDTSIAKTESSLNMNQVDLQQNVAVIMRRKATIISAK